MMFDEPENISLGEASGQQLNYLEKDLTTYNQYLQEVAGDIMKEGLSQYPIFIAHQHEVSMGEVIFDKDELGSHWSINASTLEEFVKRTLIAENRLDYFKLQYKDPSRFMCVFVVAPQGANFVFYPYQNAKKRKEKK